jgi:hypothetical protein
LYGDLSGASAAAEISIASGVIKCAAGDTIAVVSGTTTTAIGSLATQMAVTWITPA